MRNLTDPDDGRKRGLARFIHNSPWYIACLCVYFLAIVAIAQLEKRHPADCPKPQTVQLPVALPPARPAPNVAEKPMRDARIQCLASILAKSPSKLALIEEELGDSRHVCLVAEGMYPKGVVPEITQLPDWAVTAARKTIDHDD